VLESGAIEMMPDGKVAVGTRRGEIWMIDHALVSDPKAAKFTRWAHGLHEVLGLAQKDGWLYAVHRPEVTKMKDTNGDGKGDVFYTDNQGPWNGACGIKAITVGGFTGHPDSFKWYKEPEAQYLGAAPTVPKSGSRQMIEAKKIPQFYPTCVMFPYGPMGQSA